MTQIILSESGYSKLYEDNLPLIRDVMKTIIVINNNSEESLRAATVALNIAEKVGANLLIANESKINEHVDGGSKTLVGEKGEYLLANEITIVEHLRLLESADSVHRPEIDQIDISDFRSEDLTCFVISNNIWMIVTGAKELADTHTTELHINIQSVLNHVKCPLLLVPENTQLKDFEQIVYLADLRYCRLHIVRFLAELAAPYNANVFVDHVSAKGLPHIEHSYALKIFDEEVAARVYYDQLYFNNIKERDLLKVVDVMVNGMHTDLLALVHHRFHFKEILGRYISHTLPAHVIIPLLIFPY